MIARLGIRPNTLKLRPLLNLNARGYKTVVTTPEQEQNILVEQRKNRPSSPHLTIYQPQLTWYLSSVHRVSGVYLAAGFYGLTCSYAFASLLGIELNSTDIANWFHSLSGAEQLLIKGAATFPFFFHFANGIRHLIWDMGKELTLKGVYRTGYAVLAVSSVLSLIYTFI